ncbi:uncharacterized protein LOC123679764 isoform X2 [Harmonia axyridis]|uniref:uncharacterized protein LOC123679764 isoform X2 n=1 Tax=Harmonia axyridis TaxID=115357 RepID=UPI001E2756AA|nr:uncharacterized protein LOC123679764 isoform X2 [Harmonia axyridis]XP_045473205.1 uncharacterized protein LOC123679764 isoform X2 [Harmonia axyridis]
MRKKIKFEFGNDGNSEEDNSNMGSSCRSEQSPNFANSYHLRSNGSTSDEASESPASDIYYNTMPSGNSLSMESFMDLPDINNYLPFPPLPNFGFNGMPFTPQSNMNMIPQHLIEPPLNCDNNYVFNPTAPLYSAQMNMLASHYEDSNRRQILANGGKLRATQNMLASKNCDRNQMLYNGDNLSGVMQPEPPANNHPYYATNQNAVAPEIELLQDDIGEKDMDQMFKDVENIIKDIGIDDTLLDPDTEQKDIDVDTLLDPDTARETNVVKNVDNQLDSTNMVIQPDVVDHIEETLLEGIDMSFFDDITLDSNQVDPDFNYLHYPNLSGIQQENEYSHVKIEHDIQHGNGFSPIELKQEVDQSTQPEISVHKIKLENESDNGIQQKNDRDKKHGNDVHQIKLEHEIYNDIPKIKSEHKSASSTRQKKKPKVAGIKRIDKKAGRYIIDNEDEDREIDIETVTKDDVPVIEANDVNSLLEQFEATELGEDENSSKPPRTRNQKKLKEKNMEKQIRQQKLRELREHKKSKEMNEEEKLRKSREEKTEKHEQSSSSKHRKSSTHEHRGDRESSKRKDSSDNSSSSTHRHSKDDRKSTHKHRSGNTTSTHKHRSESSTSSSHKHRNSDHKTEEVRSSSKKEHSGFTESRHSSKSHSASNDLKKKENSSDKNQEAIQPKLKQSMQANLKSSEDEKNKEVSKELINKIKEANKPRTITLIEDDIFFGSSFEREMAKLSKIPKVPKRRIKSKVSNPPVASTHKPVDTNKTLISNEPYRFSANTNSISIPKSVESSSSAKTTQSPPLIFSTTTGYMIPSRPSITTTLNGTLSKTAETKSTSTSTMSRTTNAMPSKSSTATVTSMLRTATTTPVTISTMLRTATTTPVTISTMLRTATRTPVPLSTMSRTAATMSMPKPTLLIPTSTMSMSTFKSLRPVSAASVPSFKIVKPATIITAAPTISKPSTATISKPSTATISKPSTATISKPSTATISKPSTATAPPMIRSTLGRRATYMRAVSNDLSDPSRPTPAVCGDLREIGWSRAITCSSGISASTSTTSTKRDQMTATCGTSTSETISIQTKSGVVPQKQSGTTSTLRKSSPGADKISRDWLVVNQDHSYSKSVFQNTEFLSENKSVSVQKETDEKSTPPSANEESSTTSKQVNDDATKNSDNKIKVYKVNDYIKLKGIQKPNNINDDNSKSSSSMSPEEWAKKMLLDKPPPTPKKIKRLETIEACIDGRLLDNEQIDNLSKFKETMDKNQNINKNSLFAACIKEIPNNTKTKEEESLLVLRENKLIQFVPEDKEKPECRTIGTETEVSYLVWSVFDYIHQKPSVITIDDDDDENKSNDKKSTEQSSSRKRARSSSSESRTSSAKGSNQEERDENRGQDRSREPRARDDREELKDARGSSHSSKDQEKRDENRGRDRRESRARDDREEFEDARGSNHSYRKQEERDEYRDRDRREPRARDDREFKDDAMNRRILFLGDLDNDVTQEYLRTKFRKYGPIKSIKIHHRTKVARSNEGPKSQDYAFITFMDRKSVYDAINYYKIDYPHGPDFLMSFGGRRLFCREQYADLDNQPAYFPYEQGNQRPAGHAQNKPNMTFEQQLLEYQKLKESKEKQSSRPRSKSRSASPARSSRSRKRSRSSSRSSNRTITPARSSKRSRTRSVSSRSSSSSSTSSSSRSPSPPRYEARRIIYGERQLKTNLCR